MNGICLLWLKKYPVTLHKKQFIMKNHGQAYKKSTLLKHINNKLMITLPGPAIQVATTLNYQIRLRFSIVETFNL
jgi:hypothetical protein